MRVWMCARMEMFSNIHTLKFHVRRVYDRVCFWVGVKILNAYFKMSTPSGRIAYAYVCAVRGN